MLRWRWTGEMLRVEIVDPSRFIPPPVEATIESMTEDLSRSYEDLAALFRFAEELATSTSLAEFLDRSRGYTGYFQLYSVPFSKLPWLDYTEKRDIYEPGGILGGQPTIFEHWKQSGLPWMRSDWRCNDATNVAHLKQALEIGEVRLAYLFTSGLDATMHTHTTQGAATDAAFDRFEQWLREIHAIAQTRYREVRLHLFSDHGMTDTRQTSAAMLEFEALGLRYGRDYVAVWDSTMARFWFLDNEAVRERVTAWLGERNEGRIVTEPELRAWGCHFPDGRYGERICLASKLLRCLFSQRQRCGHTVAYGNAIGLPVRCDSRL